MTEIINRRGLYVYMKTMKHINVLNKFADVRYVSKKFRYVLVYVDESELENVELKLNAYKFIENIIRSPRPDMDVDEMGAGQGKLMMDDLL